MKKVTVIFLFAFLMHCSASSQVSKTSFHSINTIGVLQGQVRESLLFQSVNGMKYKKWFAGIGLGSDYYQYHTYPLFLDARKHFGKYCKFLLYADGGYNFSAKNVPGKEVGNYSSYHFIGGMYSDAGMGYRSKINHKYALLITFGFSYKAMQDNVTLAYPCTDGPCKVDYHKYKYGDGRLVVKAGVDF